jgi:hypothetical protein
MALWQGETIGQYMLTEYDNANAAFTYTMPFKDCDKGGSHLASLGVLRQ